MVGGHRHPNLAVEARRGGASEQGHQRRDWHGDRRRRLRGPHRVPHRMARGRWRDQVGDVRRADTPFARPKEVVTLCGRGRLLFESTEVPFEGRTGLCAQVCGAVPSGAHCVQVAARAPDELVTAASGFGIGRSRCWPLNGELAFVQLRPPNSDRPFCTMGVDGLRTSGVSCTSRGRDPERAVVRQICRRL